MKIKFINEYKSIKSLPDIDFSDFTILTGVNGAGKTHLLEGISNNSIQLEVGGKKVSSIIHFNYQDFIVKKIDTRQQKQQQPQPQQRIKQFYDMDVINKELQIIQEKVVLPISNVNTTMHARRKPAIYKLVDQKMFSMNINFLDDVPTIDEVVDFIMEQNPDIKNRSSQREEIKAIYDQVASTLVNIKKISKDDDLIKRYYRTSKNIGVHLAQLTKNHFKYQENVLGEKLMHEVKEYRIKQAENDHNECRKRRGENVDYKNEKEFKAINGIPPWELFDQVLDEYSCNGYLINEEITYPQIRGNINDFQPVIYLTNQSTKKVIGVEDLSSGEKTLLALALMVYKQRKGETFSEVLLLDEIDGNLHPSMIQQLLDVLEKVFINEYGMKVILVTHSPTTIALAPNDSVFMMYREIDSNERIQKEDKKTALNILTEGYATLDEGIKLFDSISQKEISILTEGNNTEYLEKANEFFGDQSKIEVIKGIEGITGKNQLKTLYDFFLRIKHDKKVIFVWDCDVGEGYRSLNGGNNTIPYVFEKNSNNKKILGGIENLFSDNLIREDFYKPEEINRQGGKTIPLSKNKMRESLIKYGNKSDFVNFEPLFKEIKEKHLQ